MMCEASLKAAVLDTEPCEEAAAWPSKVLNRSVYKSVNNNHENF